MTLFIYSQASYNIYVPEKRKKFEICFTSQHLKKNSVPDNDTLDELASASENLHPRTFISSITYYNLPRLTDDGYLAWIPKLALFFTRVTKIMLEKSVFIKDLTQLKFNCKKKVLCKRYEVSMPVCDDC